MVSYLAKKQLSLILLFLLFIRAWSFEIPIGGEAGGEAGEAGSAAGSAGKGDGDGDIVGGDDGGTIGEGDGFPSGEGGTGEQGTPGGFTDPENENPEPPFSDSEEEYGDLADHIKDLLEQISSAIDPDTDSTSVASAGATPTGAFIAQTTFPTASVTNTSFPALATMPTPTTALNATNACLIFQSYNSICSPATDFGSMTASSQQNQASCACYSGNYYVPSVYDDAASVCAKYTCGSSTPCTFQAAATSAVHAQGLCTRERNVRTLATASFGQYAAPAAPTTPPEMGGSTSIAIISLWQSLTMVTMLMAFF